MTSRFYDVPRGTYRIEADLPAGLELAQTILRDAPPPLEIAGGACLEHALTALPKARITGHVISDSGIPPTTKASLVRPNCPSL